METLHMKNTSATEMAFTMRRNDIVRVTGKVSPPLNDTTLRMIHPYYALSFVFSVDAREKKKNEKRQ